MYKMATACGVELDVLSSLAGAATYPSEEDEY